MRRLPSRDAEIRSGEWRSDYYRYDAVGPELHGSTVGLIGYGAVGSRVAAVLVALGARILVFDPYLDASKLPAGIETRASLDEVLSVSNAVTLHARLTAETQGMIGERELAIMPEGAVLINAARGALLDEVALASALSTGRLFAAGLDVYSAEPISADSPLLAAPNLVMSPHLAGATRETADRAVAVAAEQVRQYLAGGRVDHALW